MSQLTISNLGTAIGGKINNMLGIDVSHHNSKIDWKTVSSSTIPKIDFAYIKVSTGVGSMDERASYNAVEAKKNNLKIGYYHYCSLNDKNEVEDAIEEATWFLKVVKNLPVYDLPLVLDIEDNNPKVNLEDGEVENWIKTFFQTLEAKGVENYCIYSYPSFLDEHLPIDHPFGSTPLWAAQYRPHLTLPRGWNKAWMWQYTSDGRVEGISTKVDLNKSL